MTGYERTDIDIIADLGQGEVYIQAKRSAEAYRYGDAGLDRAIAWIGKAQRDLGVPAIDYSKIVYVNPVGVKVPPRITDLFSSKGIEVIEIPHL